MRLGLPDHLIKIREHRRMGADHPLGSLDSFGVAVAQSTKLNNVTMVRQQALAPSPNATLAGADYRHSELLNAPRRERFSNGAYGRCETRGLNKIASSHE
jgi:hypothetical protein